ncbi:MAG: WbqC family protein [Bacteroidia bacterium]|nr:WbqC family protein [Bacteroidia bacterium]
MSLPNEQGTQEVFPLCYFAPVHWFAAWVQASSPIGEAHIWYQKQQLSSRTWIKGPERVLPLTIPVERRSEKIAIGEKRVSYQENWPETHLRSWKNYYQNSPYYYLYEDEIKAFYALRHPLLIDWIMASHTLACKWLKISDSFPLSVEYLEPKQSLLDFRGDFHGKSGNLPSWYVNEPYSQVFEPFEGGLSILDLVFNSGPIARSYLKRGIT